MHMPTALFDDVAAQVTERPGSIPGLASCLLPDAGLFGRFLELHRSLEGGATPLHRDALLLRFFAGLVQRVGGGRFAAEPVRRESAPVRRAQELLDARYDQNVSLKELAAVANLSPYYLHRVFCRETGMPPHAYQVQLRILHAKTFVRGHWPLADVASMMGFADQSHFTRHFKRLVGVSPARYARQGKNVQDARAAGP
jgi:AraC-like DNA-binding protein